MIDKYVAAIVLVVSNVLGLTALSNIDNRTQSYEFVESIAPETTVSVQPQKLIAQAENIMVNTKPSNLIEYYGITFKHGDVSWLPGLAAQAGWPKETHSQLESIILRESGGCPNRRGGDAVNKNCKITHVTEWNHRSDTGLLQINGVNYDLSRNKWARVCTDLGMCEQHLLLDPLNNLKAGYLLYQYSGWGPWDPCTWGEKWKHRCKSVGKP